ncbi:unnamed protein product, partial [Tilletia caries]
DSIFNFDPNSAAASSTVVYPFPDCPYPIPPDLIELHRGGHQVPLSLLTLYGISAYVLGSRMPFSLPLDSNSAHSNSARALDEWLNTDRFLPFAEWIQASSFYTVLLNKAADNPALGVHEAAVYGGHVFAVQTRVHGSNWDIFREYDRRVRQEVAGCRKTSTRMRFDIRSINQPLLILSASA